MDALALPCLIPAQYRPYHHTQETSIALTVSLALLFVILSFFIHWIVLAVCAVLFLFSPPACLALLLMAAAVRYFLDH